MVKLDVAAKSLREILPICWPYSISTKLNKSATRFAIECFRRDFRRFPTPTSPLAREIHARKVLTYGNQKKLQFIRQHGGRVFDPNPKSLEKIASAHLFDSAWRP